MTLAALLTELDRHQIRCVADGRDLKLAGSKTALTPELLELIRQHKSELLAHLHTLDTPEPLRPSADALETAAVAELDRQRHERDRARGHGYDYARVEDSDEDEIDRLATADGWKPLPEIPATIDAEITRIEAEALGLGWDLGRLWNFEFWPHRRAEPRGLASIMDQEDRIGAVTVDYIEILKIERNILRFQRRAS